MKYIELIAFVIVFTIGGILLFGVDAKPFEILSTYALMYLSMIYTNVRELNDKL